MLVKVIYTVRKLYLVVLATCTLSEKSEKYMEFNIFKSLIFVKVNVNVNMTLYI